MHLLYRQSGHVSRDIEVRSAAYGRRQPGNSKRNTGIRFSGDGRMSLKIRRRWSSPEPSAIGTDDSWPPPGARSFLLDGAARREGGYFAHIISDRFRGVRHSGALRIAGAGARAHGFEFSHGNPGRKYPWMFFPRRCRGIRTDAFVRSTWM